MISELIQSSRDNLIFTKYPIKNILSVFFLLLLVAYTLMPGLDGPLVFDDYRNLAPFLDKEVNYKTAIFENEAGPFGRSITMFTFAINYWLRDELITFDLKLTNLFIHLLNGILIYCLISILLQITLSQEKASGYAWIISAIWLINPVNTETVLYVIQRATLLAAMFMLMVCILYIRIRLSFRKFNFRTCGLLALCILGWICAMLSKENAVLLPLVILCMEACFFKEINLQRSGTRLLLFGMPLLIISILLINRENLLDYSNTAFSLQERLISQPVAIMSYLKEMLFPRSVDIGIFRDDFIIGHNTWNRVTIYSLVFVVLLIIASLLNLRSRNKYVSAGILIFFSGHLLESTIFPLDLYYRHRNYFPSMGILLAIVMIFDEIKLSNSTRKLLFVITVAYCFILGQHSFVQSQVWSSFNTMLVNAYRNHPKSVRASLEITGKLVSQKDLPASLAVNSAIISARPLEALPAKIQRFYIYCELADAMPEIEYDILQKDLNLLHPQNISSAFDHLLNSYKRRQCEFVKLRRIIETFISWSDTQRATGRQSSMDLWTIDYYMIEYLLLLDEKEQAIQRLDLLIGQGNTGAAYYREHNPGM